MKNKKFGRLFRHVMMKMTLMILKEQIKRNGQEMRIILIYNGKKVKKVTTIKKEIKMK